MANLLVNFSYGNWYAMIANTQISYKFAGATAEDQIVQVRFLAQKMTEGENMVYNYMTSMFDNVTYQNAQNILDELFDTTTELYYQAAPVISVAEGETLLSCIEDVGEAFLAVL